MFYFLKADSAANIKSLARIASENSFKAKLKALEIKYYNWEDAVSFLTSAQKGKKKIKKGTSKKDVDAEEKALNSDEEISDASSIDEEEEISGMDEDLDSSDNEVVNSPLAVSEDDASTVEQVITKKSNKKQTMLEKNNTTKPKNTKAKVVIDKKVHKNPDILTEVASVSVVRKIRNLEDLEHFESVSKDISTSSVVEARKDSFFLSADGEEVESEVEEESADDESEDEINQGPNKIYHNRGREENHEPRRTFGALNNQESSGKQNQRFRQNQPQKRFVIYISLRLYFYIYKT